MEMNKEEEWRRWRTQTQAICRNTTRYLEEYCIFLCFRINDFNKYGSSVYLRIYERFYFLANNDNHVMVNVDEIDDFLLEEL